MSKEQLNLWNDLKEGNTLGEVQEYIRKVIEIRGFSNQSIEQAMLLLTEEIGELAKAIRKEKTTMSIDNNKSKIMIQLKVKSQMFLLYYVQFVIN